MDKNIQVPLLYIVIHLGLIFFMYPTNVIDSTDDSHWVPILIALIIHIGILGLYLKGLSYFPNQTVITIYSNSGKLYSLLFLVPLAFYFFMALIITVRAYSEIIIIIFLSNTPLWSVMLLLLIITTFLAILGIETIFRSAMFLTILFLPIILFVIIVSFQNADWYYFLPVWSNDFSFLTNASYFKSFFAVGGGFLFLGMIQPDVKYQIKSILIATAIIAPFFFISVYVPILTFGQATAATMLFPFVVATDAVSINWLPFDRITMFFLLSSFIFIMLFISIITINTAKILNHYLPKINLKYIVLLTTVATFIICLFIPNWTEIDSMFKWNTFLRFYVIFLIPLSLFILGIRSSRKKGMIHA